MAQGRSALSFIALVIGALVVPGCGGDSEAGPASVPQTTNAEKKAPVTPSSSAKEKEKPKAQRSKPKQERPATTNDESVPIVDIALKSPAIGPVTSTGGPLLDKHTCDGEDSSPPLEWSGVPDGTVELALFVMNLATVENELFFDWAVIGLDPKLTSLEAGTLPDSAIVGRNGFGKVGYSICPLLGKPETYIFALYALPQRLSANKGFEAGPLREQALRLSTNAGLLAASYERE